MRIKNVHYYYYYYYYLGSYLDGVNFTKKPNESPRKSYHLHAVYGVFDVAKNCKPAL